MTVLKPFSLYLVYVFVFEKQKYNNDLLVTFDQFYDIIITIW